MYATNVVGVNGIGTFSHPPITNFDSTMLMGNQSVTGNYSKSMNKTFYNVSSQGNAARQGAFDASIVSRNITAGGGASGLGINTTTGLQQRIFSPPRGTTTTTVS